jgi:hypothetical protein
MRRAVIAVMQTGDKIVRESLTKKNISPAKVAIANAQEL